MPPSQSYFFDVILVGLGLLFIVYIVYGRIKRRSIFGNCKPGDPGYAEFLKFINNSKFLILATLGTLFFFVSAILDAKDILKETTSHSILVVAPIMVGLGFLGLAMIIPRMLIGKRK
jgi:hypothetical protein